MIWTLPDQDAKTPNNHTDLYLQTNLESEFLQKRLFYIAQESKSVFEEQGCTILYLATGFLEWTEIPKGEVHKAPLILIPVEIERDQIRTSFKLTWTGEDLITNISLQAKLSEIGVNLPSFEMPEKKDGIELYFKTVADNIRGQENWQVTKEIRLDFFTFSKFMMYKDLDPTAWPVGNSPALHPLIAAIFGDGPSSETGFGGGLPFPEQEVDARLPTRSVYHVLDADSSQIAVIQDLKSGTNLVVEGPPGTGKSQTIANVIAEFLAIGKTVLFVSEKMAALEVVKGRLDSLGLGIFCLELHNSKKANKKKVLGEIQRAIGVRGPTQKDNDEVLQNVEDLRSELNRYTAALSTPVGRLGLTPYQLYGMSESARRLFIANGHQMPVVTLPLADTITPTTWSPAIRTLEELDALVPLVSPIKENPWRFCTPGSFFSNDVEEVSRLLSSAVEDLSLIRTNAEQLVEWAGIANPTTQTELVNAIHSTEILIASEPIDQSVLLNESWNEPNNEAEGLIQKIETYQAFRASLASRMQESIFVADLASLILEFETSSKKILHSLIGPNNKIWAHNQMPNVSLPPLDSITLARWSPAIRTLEELDTILLRVSPIKENPWRFCTPGSFSVNDVEEISRLLYSALENLSLIRTSAEQLVECAGIASPTTQTELVNAVHATEILIASKPIDQSVLLNASWNEPNNEAEGLIQKIEMYQTHRAPLASRMQESVFAADHASLILEFETSSKNFFHSLFGPYKKIRAQIDGYYLTREERSDEALLADLREVQRCYVLKKEIQEISSLGRLMFGAHWRGEESNPKYLRAFSEWIVKFRHELLTGVLTPRSIQIVSHGVATDHVYEITTTIEEARARFNSYVANLLGRLSVDSTRYFPNGLEVTCFDDVQTVLESWLTGIDHLVLWTQYLTVRKEVEGTIKVFRTILAPNLPESVFAADLDSLILDLHSLFGPYKKIRAQIDGYYLTQEERSDTALLAGLREVQRCHALKQEIQEVSSLGQLMFGAHWRGEESSPEHLRAFSGWIVKFRHELLTDVLTPRSVEIVSCGVDSDRVREITIKIEEARVRFNSHMADLLGRLSVDSTKYFPLNHEATHFDNIQTVFESWLTGIDRLVPWTQYVAVRKEVEKSVAAPLVPLVEQGQLQCGEFRTCLEANYAMSLLRLVFDQNPTLERFVGHVHNKRIEDFVKLDHRMIRENTLRIARRLCQNRPVLVGGASPSSEIGFLQTQIYRKRGHASIRQLLTKAMKPIQQIKPCFMMSPPSIAQFLDPCLIKFDIVIFDEASQVKPAEALGAILRGKQVAVIGDSRQLPPTSFFDKIVAASENEDRDDAMPSDMESILNLCKTRFPNRTLLWHYRSRHDSLITLSNQEFYNNDLYVFPSPMRDGEELGLKFVYLPETVYDRGKSGMNRGEARKVAESVIDHARRYPKKSLGVGTFNIHQQEAILEELERLRGENPDLEEFFGDKGTETFFVKNLEMIQGDERDVIFLSVGFGYDAQHKFSMNFGALNKDGGERRLNVLITRARLRCVVFANFRARELPVADIQSASRGVQVLKLFLEYAETGKVPCTMEPLADCDSPFEESVYAFLTENGYVVHKQVGCKGYRIDLAVVNPEIPGEYLIGVECDGATYHSSRVARDRDRLRQEILEGLGWRITRVWSTDWFRKLGACQKDLKAAIEKAQEAAHEKIVLPGPAPKPELTAEEADFQAKIESVSGTLTNTAPPDKEMPLAPAYVICDSLKVPKGIDPKDFPPQKMAMLIEQVVKIEGPVYYEEMVRRIRDAFGVKRTGNQIRAAIDAGVGSAVEHRTVKCKGEFLWPLKRPVSIVRRRGETIKPQIEMICNEELEEAALFVLKWQYATKMEALVTGVCHVVGIRKVNEETKERAQLVIARMISRGMIEVKLNGLIDISVGQEKTQPAPSSSRWDRIKID